MRSENFFYEIQGKFKAAQASERHRSRGGWRGGDFQGRYMGHLLKAVGSRHAEVYNVLAGARACWTGDIEYVYNDEGRRADLALSRSDEDQPCVLVEIKAADGANADFNAAQLRDYDRWAQAREGRSVLLLTHYPLPPPTRELLKGPEFRGRVRHLRIDTLAARLRLAGGMRGSSLLGLFLEYLEQQGLVMTELTPDDILSLKTFLAFSFLPHVGQAGRNSKTERVTNGASAFSIVVKNWQMLATHVNDAQSEAVKELGGKRKLGRRTLKFRACPLYQEGTRLQTFEQSWDAKTYERKLGGSWIVYSDTVLGQVGTKNLHLRCGLNLAISKGTSKKRELAFDSNVYAAVWLGKWDLGVEASAPLRPEARAEKLYQQYAEVLSDQAGLQRALKSCIRKAVTKAIGSARKEEKPALMKMLQDLREPLLRF